MSEDQDEEAYERKIKERQRAMLAEEEDDVLD